MKELIDRVLEGHDPDCLIDLLIEGAGSFSGVPTLEDKRSFLSQLHPGDILLSRRDRTANPFKLGVLHAISHISGGYFTHAGMYIGNGQMVHGIFRGVVRDPVEQLMDRGSVLIVRPRASDQEKKLAVEHMKQQVGKPYSYNAILQTGAHTLYDRMFGKGRGPHKQRTRPPEYSVICSNLIAMSYPTIVFSSRTPKRFVTPEQLRKSTMTRSVAMWKPSLEPVHA